MSNDSTQPWRALLDVARFAPSPHNTQPWKIRPRSECDADLFLVRSRTLPDEDTTGCFLQCGMGCFLECLVNAAANAGYRLSISIRRGDPALELIPFAVLRLEPDPTARGEYSDALITARRTSRLPPDERLVPDPDLKSFADIANAGGHLFSHTRDPLTCRQIIDINVQALFHDLNCRPYHDEIAMWFRYGKAHAARTRDGLDSACMNVPAHELYCSVRWPRLMTSPVTRGVMRRHVRRRIGPVRHLGFLSGRFFEPDAAVAAGRCLMRLWLAMYRIGVTIHPFGNLVTNPQAHTELTRVTGIPSIWLVFRMGYTAAAPRSHRLETEALLC